MTEQEKLAFTTNLKAMPLSSIADSIRDFWKNMYFGAVPYIDAMGCLTTVNDSCGMDSGRSVVNYALANMQSFRGEEAKLIKKELQRRLKA